MKGNSSTLIPLECGFKSPWTRFGVLLKQHYPAWVRVAARLELSRSTSCSRLNCVRLAGRRLLYGISGDNDESLLSFYNCWRGPKLPSKPCFCSVTRYEAKNCSA